jgi:hypothetical protein
LAINKWGKCVKSRKSLKFKIRGSHRTVDLLRRHARTFSRVNSQRTDSLIKILGWLNPERYRQRRSEREGPSRWNWLRV